MGRQKNYSLKNLKFQLSTFVLQNIEQLMILFNDIYELLLRNFTVTVFIQPGEQFVSLGCVGRSPNHFIHGVDGPEIELQQSLNLHDGSNNNEKASNLHLKCKDLNIISKQPFIQVFIYEIYGINLQIKLLMFLNR